MGDVEVAHAIQWLAGNPEWSTYIAEHGAAAVAQAYATLTPHEQQEVWVAVRQRLGLTTDIPASAHHVPDPQSHRENAPMMPGDGTLPRADGTPDIHGGGIDGTFDARHGIQVTGANLQGIGNDPVDVPANRHAYRDPTTDTDPAAPGMAAVDHAIQHAMHPSEEQIHAQWSALQAFGHTVAELGRVSASGQPTEVQQAIVLCLTAAQDLLHAGNALDVVREVAHALQEWDGRCPDPHVGTHQDWLLAAGTVHGAADEAYRAWETWCSSTYGLLGGDQSMPWYATQLAEAAVHAHAAIGSAAQL